MKTELPILFAVLTTNIFVSGRSTELERTEPPIPSDSRPMESSVQETLLPGITNPVKSDAGLEVDVANSSGTTEIDTSHDQAGDQEMETSTEDGNESSQSNDTKSSEDGKTNGIKIPSFAIQLVSGTVCGGIGTVIGGPPGAILLGNLCTEMVQNALKQ